MNALLGIETFYSFHPGIIDSYVNDNNIYVLHENPSSVVVYQCSGYEIVSVKY